MMDGLIGLSETIHEYTGEEGRELEALTFYVAACYADMMQRKDIGDYFIKRCNESYEKSRFND